MTINDENETKEDQRIAVRLAFDEGRANLWYLVRQVNLIVGYSLVIKCPPFMNDAIKNVIERISDLCGCKKRSAQAAKAKDKVRYRNHF